MRRHPTYADVVSTLCLVMLLGGTAYAATQVTGKDIKNSSVTGKDIRDKSLKGPDVKDGSLNGADVAGLGPDDVAGLGPDDVAGLGPDDIAGLDAADLRAGALPGARAERDSGTIPDGTSNAVDLTTEGFDTANMYTVGDDFITVPRTGTYLVVGYVSWGGAGAGTRQLRVNVDSVLRQVVVDHSTPAEFGQQITSVQTLTAGQQVTLGAVNGSGGAAALSAFGGQAEISLTVQMLSP
jgi:hypothetical protein